MLVVTNHYVGSCFCYSRAKRKIKLCLQRLLIKSGKVKARVRGLCAFRKSYEIFFFKSMLLDSFHLLIPGADVSTFKSSPWSLRCASPRCLLPPAVSAAAPGVRPVVSDAVALPNCRKPWWKLSGCFHNASVFLCLILYCDKDIV